MAGYLLPMQLIKDLRESAFYLTRGILKIATAKMLRIVLKMEAAK